MKNATSLLLVGAMGLTLLSCSKDKNDPVTTGGITGLVTPATALVSVTATLGTGAPVTGTISPAGYYTFVNLPAGSYTVTYVAAMGFTAPAPQVAVVTAGSTLTLAAITIQPATVSKTDLLTAKTWKLTDVTTSGTSVFSLLVPACNQDDLIRFNINKTAVYDANLVKCAPTDPQTQNGSWEFLANETGMKLTPPTGAAIEGQIVTLSATTLKLNGNVDYMGIPVPAEVTFTAQ